MVFAVFETSKLKTMGVDTDPLRKNVYGNECLVHINNLNAKQLGELKNAKTYDNGSPEHKALLTSEEWAYSEENSETEA